MKATLTSKGRLTLPKAVREALELRPGDELFVRLEGGRILLVPRRRYRASDLEELIPKAPTPVPGREGEKKTLIRALIEKERRLR